MDPSRQPGALSVSVLNGRRSASADAARLALINKELQMTPRERMLRALSLGLGEDAPPVVAGDGSK